MREKDDMVKSEQLYLFKLDYWWRVRFTMIFPLSGWKPKEQDLSKSSVSSKPFEEKCKISSAPPTKIVWFSLPFHCSLGRRRGRVEWRASSPFPPTTVLSGLQILLKYSSLCITAYVPVIGLFRLVSSPGNLTFCVCCSGKTTCILRVVAFRYITARQIHSSCDHLLCVCFVL